MSVYHPYEVKCPACGTGFTAPLARGININRTPALKQQIIDGSFHTVTCPSCRQRHYVEKEFSYIDFAANLFIKVRPRQEKHLWKEASAELSQQVKEVPESLSHAGSRTLRVVFGLAELKEKIIAQQYSLDDRMVELMKALLIHDHPVLIQLPRVSIVLGHIDDTALHFFVSYDHDKKNFRLTMPRWLADDVLSRSDEMEQWVNNAHKNNSLFRLTDDHWINFWRWSPQPSALDQLRAFAQQVELGAAIDTDSPAFNNMVTYIPHGNQLPPWAKQDLNTLFRYAKQKNLQKLEDTLFEVRFGKTLEDDWYLNNDPNDIDTLWKLLASLPETNVDGNTSINELFLDTTSGGAYDPGTGNIYIGSLLLGYKEDFEDVVRHEVGHGVHEKFKADVDSWLGKEFGWQTFTTSNADIDSWIALMGGWDNLNAMEQAQVRSYLVQAIGGGQSWNSGQLPFIPANHPWNRPDFGPRLAFEHTGSNWFQNYTRWYRFNGKAFFMNYWYQTFCAVDETALALVDNMPSNYAAMSHFEFFAELYALYYDLDDPQRPNIPQHVAKWLDDHVGRQEAPHAMPAQPAERKTFDWVKRPG